ncbi:hypothetical protein [Halobacterium bonnevillei]|uniref:Uncharacterized protein n=1 Tax=Halobacterium bonnevillei TaxID=2692200 RepID=A0A6B0SET8_9EURY|nr:hypothetical protein [Halobacterium bonnevillei]MXR19196.1 hypothetical protein [Halobacterium bonnevillei]
MSGSNTPGCTSLDTPAMQEAVEGTIDGTLRSFVEFDSDNFTVVHYDDRTRSFYDDEAHMMEHFEEIHSYVHIDFTEVDFFTERLFPITDHVRYFATSFDVFTLLRVYFDDEGLFLALDRDEPVEPVVEAIEAVHGSR